MGLDYRQIISKIFDHETNSLNIQGQVEASADSDSDVLLNKVFWATTNDVAGTSGQAVPFFLLRNPVGSKKTIKIRQLLLATCVSTNNNIFRGYAQATVTADGAALAIVSSRVQGQMPASAMQAFLKPTVSAQSSQHFVSCVGPTTTFPLPMAPPIMVLEGQQFLVTCRNNTTGVTGGVTATWVEE